MSKRPKVAHKLIHAGAVAIAALGLTGGMLTVSATSMANQQAESNLRLPAKEGPASSALKPPSKSSSTSPLSHLKDLAGTKLSIAILGDSYSSGVGGGLYSGGWCFRSPNSAGNLYAARLRARGVNVTVKDSSCANSQTEHVTESQRSNMMGSSSSVINRPQIEAISSSTDLVIMTMGGNDIGFGNLLKTCLMTNRQADACRDTINAAKQSIDNVATSYRRVFQAIEKQGLRSDAKIVVMAYPMLVRDDSYSVRDSSGNEVRVSDEIRALSREGNKRMSDMVNEHNAKHPGQAIFVSDIPDRFENHQPHANGSRNFTDDLWINPVNYLSVRSFLSWYHPNVTGYRQYEKALHEKLKSTGFEAALARKR
jgi:GDSL-like Lipase/Acylhydrolase.